MDEIQRFDYSSFESLPDFDDQLITMETTLSSDDYMCDTIEAIRLNEWMNAIDFASSSTMIDSKHSVGGVNGEEQQTLDDRLQYDRRWKNEEEFTRFSTCDLEASQRESLSWPDHDHDHPVLHSMDVLNSCGISCPERKSDLPDLGQRDYLFFDGSNHHSSQGLEFCKSARSVAGRNLISERKRRTKVNQSLYTLRSLVPFITKMDKASIVKDTMVYIQHLQNQVKEIEGDIAALQSNNRRDCSSSVVSDNDSSIHKDHVHAETASPHPMPLSRSKHEAQTVLQVDACKIQETTFRIAIYCLKQPGLLVQMTKALESIQILEVKSSNILSFHGYIVNTVIAKIKEGREIMEADGLKQMILRAASEYGFPQEL